MRVHRADWFFRIATGALFATALVGLAELVALQRQIAAAQPSSPARGKRAPDLAAPAPVIEVDRALGEAAASAGLRRLSSVRRLGPEKVEVDFEGRPDAALAFLSIAASRNILGACERVRMIPADESGADVSVQAVFNPIAPAGAADAGAGNASGAKPRNAFVALWRAPRRDVHAESRARLARIERERRRAAAEREEETRARREAAEREAQRNRIASALSLTGIVHNGSEPIAFIGSGGGSTLARTGDTILGATVTAIREERGEVEFDYAGRFQFVLRLDGGAR